MDRYTTYISEETLKEIDPEAAQKNSNDTQNLYSLEYIGISRAVFTSGLFSFNPYNNKNSISNNISFFMTKSMMNESEINIKKNYFAYDNEEIGFNVYKGNKIKAVAVEYDPNDMYYWGGDEYYDYIIDDNHTKKKEVLRNNGYYLEEETNLISQLKKQKIISSYSFFIKYDKNEEKGEIIIGGLPHEYDPKHYSEKYYVYNTISLGQSTPKWQTTFDDIKYGNQSVKYTRTGEFSLDYGFIVTSSLNKDYFDEVFFKNPKYEDYCNEEIIDIYFVKYCDKKVIKEFQNIYFYLSPLYNEANGNNRIEFDYNDLFIKVNNNDDYYYFQIVFQSDYYNWLFGRPLFKKYPMVFNQNAKIFGFYTQTTENNINSEEKNEKSNSSFVSLIIIIVILAICLILLIIAFILYALKKRSRKAYELNDDYDYNSASINK
jgi:hypothetical protein